MHNVEQIILQKYLNYITYKINQITFTLLKIVFINYTRYTITSKIMTEIITLLFCFSYNVNIIMLTILVYSIEISALDEVNTENEVPNKIKFLEIV